MGRSDHSIVPARSSHRTPRAAGQQPEQADEKEAGVKSGYGFHIRAANLWNMAPIFGDCRERQRT